MPGSRIGRCSWTEPTGRRGTRERVAAQPEPAAGGTPLESLARLELHGRIVEQVLALAEPSRDVIVRRFFEEPSLEQVAAHLEVPVETVKSRQKRALQQLRSQLVDAGDLAERRERRRALALLAGGTGGVDMTLGVNSWIACAAGVVLLAWLSRSTWLGAAGAADGADGAASASRPAAVDASLQPAVSAASRELTPALEAPGSAASETGTSRPPQIGGLEVHLSGDFVDDVATPLPGRTVELYDRPDDLGAERFIASVLTDEAGRFTFEPVRISRRSTAVVIAWDGAACAGVHADPSHDRPIHLVLGLTKLIVGRVVDVTGVPVAEARVMSSARVRGMSRPQHFELPRDATPRVTVHTAADGTFVVPGLPRLWRVTLEVECDGFANYKNHLNLDESAADLPLTIVLHPESCIEGVVTLADGAPAPGIRVDATLEDRNDRPFRSRNCRGTAVTDAEGDYRIRGLEDGPWTVSIALTRDAQARWCAPPPQAVQLSAAATLAPVDFVLRPGGELVVHVADSTSHEPVEGVEIGVRPLPALTLGALIRATVSGGDGTARLRLPAGSHFVFPHADVFTPSWRRRNFEIVEGESIELWLDIGRGVTLAGTVSLPDGRPAAGAIVWCSEGSRSRLDRGGTIAANDGTFTLPALRPADRFRLFAATRDAGLTGGFLVDPATCDPAQIQIILEPRPRTHVSGRIVDGEGRGVAGVEVKAVARDPHSNEWDQSTPDPACITTTDGSGTFTFDGLWCDVTWTLSAGWSDLSGDSIRICSARAEVAPLATDEERDVGDLVLKSQLGR